MFPRKQQMPCCVPVLVPGKRPRDSPLGSSSLSGDLLLLCPLPLPSPFLPFPSLPLLLPTTHPLSWLAWVLGDGPGWSPLLNFLKKYLFIWLCWVLVAARAFLELWRTGFSLRWLLCGSRALGSVLVATGVSCSLAWDIFPDQGSNLCLLHWQEDSWPLSHWGSPCLFLKHLPGHLRLHFLTLTRENLVSEAQDLSNYCACFAFSVSLLKLLKAGNVLFLPSAPWS